MGTGFNLLDLLGGETILKLKTDLGGLFGSFFRLLGNLNLEHIHILGKGFKGFSLGFSEPSFKTGGTFKRKNGLYSIKKEKRSRLL